MISTVSIKNLHLDAIAELLDDGKRDAEYLIVAHQDHVLERCLASAFVDAKAALYQVPQQTWEMEDEDLSEAIQWAVEIGGVKNVILVGCSSANIPQTGADSILKSLGPDADRPTVIERARNAVVARRCAQDHFPFPTTCPAVSH